MNLRIVVLDLPYFIWEQQGTQDIFCEMVRLKRAGYGPEYPSNVLAVDGSDFIATHFLVCEDLGGGKYRALTGYKAVSFDRCKTHHVVFPALAMFRSSNAPLHERVLAEIAEDCTSKRMPLEYIGSWTVDPGARDGAKDFDVIKEIVLSIEVLRHDGYTAFRTVTGAVVRFKIGRIHEFLGFEPFMLNNQVLPPISAAFVEGEQVAMNYMKSFTPGAKAMAEKWRAMWEDRLVVGGEKQVLPKAA